MTIFKTFHFNFFACSPNVRGRLQEGTLDLALLTVSTLTGEKSQHQDHLWTSWPIWVFGGFLDIRTTTWSSGWTKNTIDWRGDLRRNSCSGTITRWRVAGNLMWWFQERRFRSAIFVINLLFRCPTIDFLGLVGAATVYYISISREYRNIA